ncbi:hypothetical protein RJ639_026334 [Escallonia herrerae]|uniref:Cytochrome P450 n=1 Tax=Escallonia herrerae TaxID=1293975 RepID=A0AA89AD76_9ASTE|nr:hypothetical protein RJ639_026334 [Escallonia herrerae]
MDFFLPLFNSVILAVLTLFLVVYYLSSRPRTAKSRVAKTSAAPEPDGAWPIIGHLHLLGGSQLPHITLGAMADINGPIFTLRLGVHRALVVSNWEIAKELYTSYDVVISSRPKSRAAKHLGYDYAMFAFSPYGAYWRELRKITSIELLSSRRLELLKHVRISEIEICIKELYELWSEKKNNSGRVLVEMKQWFGDLTLNVILRMVAGKRYFGSSASGDEAEARRCQKVMRAFFHYPGLFLVSDMIPFLGWLDLGGHEKGMKETAKEMDSIVEEWLKEHREMRSSAEDEGVQKDFIDVLLSAVDGAVNLSGFDADTITKSTCLTLIAGGSDTTTVMLIWALSLLLNNRHALKRIQDELDAHVGKDRQVNESDINNLVYLQAVVKETLRLYPAGPLPGQREFTEDCTVGGFHVPKGTRLMLNLWKLQRDPKVWSNPTEFRPERFLTTHKDVDAKGQHFELIPFGAGRRLCPGINFGLQMLHLVLATLLHSFELSTLVDAPVDMTESTGLTNIKATPLEVLLAPRLSPNIY